MEKTHEWKKLQKILIKENYNILFGGIIMKKIFLILTSIFLIFTSCAAPIYNLSRTQYLQPEFQSQALFSDGIALLPVTAGKGQEGYRRLLGDALNTYLPKAIPGGKILTWQEVIRLLNKDEKITEYKKLIISYEQTAIIDKKLANKLYTTLKVRYALYCSLKDFYEYHWNKYYPNLGSIPQQKDNISAHCLIIDLQTGDIIQEIIGHVSSSTDISHRTINYNYNQYANIMARTILQKIPGSKIPPLPVKLVY